jgi:diacylglycerol kinase family enzyme
VTHASITTLQSPHSKLQDGIFNILVVRKPCSRWDLLKLLLGLERGIHVDNPKAEFFQCTSFRLDPETDGSFNNIDGEVVEPGRIQGQVIPAMMKFFT